MGYASVSIWATSPSADGSHLSGVTHQAALEVDRWGTIQGLKKSSTKGDKKKKKEITEEIAKLEAELKDRQEKELAEVDNEETTDQGPPEPEVNNLSIGLPRSKQVSPNHYGI